MFGWGIALEDHAMSKVVEGWRRDHADRELGHAFVACGSWDPRDYLYAYLTEASAAKPDLVVLGVFTGNDIMPADAPRILDPSEAPYVDRLPDPPRPLMRSFDWIRAQLSGSLFVSSLRAKHQRPAAFAPFEDDMAKQQRLWDTSFFYLRALHEAVRKDGGELAIVLYPSMLQVNAARALDAAGYDHRMPERVMGAFAAENGIALVTLLEALEAHNEKQDLFFPKDRHLTTRGFAVAAEAMEAKLRPMLDRLWKERGRARIAAHEAAQN
jgi:hypothetical protein